MSEFAERSRGADARVLIGGCLELGADGLPFAPFTSVLRNLVRDLGAARVAELLPGGAARELARLLPEFGEPAGSHDAGEARVRLFEQTLILLERLAEAGPVVLVIEDMQWADRSSRDLLAFLIRNQASLDGVLIVVTYRSDDLHHTHPLRPLLAELDRIGWVTRMDLGRLTRADTGQLVAQIIGREPHDELLAAVHRRSEGNPLFVEALLYDGAQGSELPQSLRDLLVAAVRRLPGAGWRGALREACRERGLYEGGAGPQPFRLPVMPSGSHPKSTHVRHDFLYALRMPSKHLVPILRVVRGGSGAGRTA